MTGWDPDAALVTQVVHSLLSTVTLTLIDLSKQSP